MSYPYANGIIATFDENTFNAKKLLKLKGLDKDQFISGLLEINYGSKNNVSTSIHSVEGLIENEMKALKVVIEEITPDASITNLLFLFHDTNIIKAFLKMKYFNQEILDLNNPLGNMSIDALKKAIFEEELSELNKDYQNLIKTINRDLKNYETALIKKEESLSSREFSALIDKAIFKFIKTKLMLTLQTPLVTYFKTYADFKNLLSFIRARRLKWSIGKFLEMFIDYSKINSKVYKDIYQSSEEVVLNELMEFYNGRLSKTLKKYYLDQNLDNLEKTLDTLMLEIMKEFKFDAFGVGPIIYYYLIKEAEAKNILLLYSNQDPDMDDLIEY